MKNAHCEIHVILTMWDQLPKLWDLLEFPCEY